MSKNKIYKTIIMNALALMIPLSALAQDMSNWRTPTKSELAHDLDWRKEDPNLYLKAKADFDGDGKEDTASLLINDKKNKMGLFVELSSRPGKRIKLDEIEDKSWIEVMGITVAKPGNYKTACGKGYFDCEKGEPEALNLKLPAIDYFKEGSANSFFIWDKKTKQFQRIWMSD
ncbi:MAG: hypothetical protein Q8K51_05690 [Nitrospirota bacterium]|nr:hypothetical protein [Nitrospirota bacterium]